MASFTLLADALYREEVARARAMRAGDKLLEGPRLFDRACRVMADGVRHRHPDLDEKAVLAMVAKQLDLLKALEALCDTGCRSGGSGRDQGIDSAHIN